MFTEQISRTVLSVLVGETIALECLVRGSPFPEVDWSQNGTVIVETERTNYYNHNQLVIIRSVKLTDGGDYLCRASNAIGTIRRTVTVKVLLTSNFDEP